MQWKKLGVYLGSMVCFLGTALGGLAAEAFGYPASPVIQEILFDQEGRDGSDIFTEIYGPPGMSLEGWRLIGVNGSNGSVYREIDLAGAIPANGIYLVVQPDAPESWRQTAALEADYDWQNGPDAVQLLDGEDVVWDALHYGSGAAVFAGEGLPAPIAPAGFSLSRDPLGTDTDDNAVDFTLLETPTPGMAAAPLPAALYLLGSGLLPLWYLKRRSRA